MAIAMPGACNPEDPDVRSGETRCASCKGGYSATSESLHFYCKSRCASPGTHLKPATFATGCSTLGDNSVHIHSFEITKVPL